jgi:phenylpropionate dioxygenase-like ring-hydroxylating dioxygenase large terminal subunit
MDLPASVVALGEQLRGAVEIAPDPALFHDADVFAAERERIFVRPLIAVDHQSRLAEDEHYFRCDAGPRSIVVTRESGGRLHALRNVCIHAGYPVCDAQEGRGDRLICLYHGWEYELDGRLVEPALSSRIDPSRLRLMEYPVQVCNGLMFVDLSGAPSNGAEIPGSVPGWLADARVTHRARYSTTWNWKFVRHFLRSRPDLFVADPPGADDRDSWLEFGPLSSMILCSDRAVLLRVIPKFAEQTDFDVIQMTAADAPESAGSDVVADGIRGADDSPSWFDRRFADWYWSLMSPQP